MNDKQLQALAKKNAAKAQQAQKQRSKSYDPTLDATRRPDADEAIETERMFREMKRREF